jgi:hypothetical protein
MMVMRHFGSALAFQTLSSIIGGEGFQKIKEKIRRIGFQKIEE